MNTFLFPHYLKKLGWLLFVPSLLIAIVLSFNGEALFNGLTMPVFAIAADEIFTKTVFFGWIKNPVLDEILLCLIIIGGLIVGFSRVRNEDEMIARIRYESLVWAVYFNFGLTLLATIFIYGSFYLQVMMFNLFALLFFFIIRFHIKLYQLNRSLRHEE
jgi:hypothetical protein